MCDRLHYRAFISCLKISSEKKKKKTNPSRKLLWFQVNWLVSVLICMCSLV